MSTNAVLKTFENLINRSKLTGDTRILKVFITNMERLQTKQGIELPIELMRNQLQNIENHDIDNF
ncbi:hypothetical protein M3202_18505 [Alkalihalobacillus oceani]|uniref:Uncharacterized protein n=1 Tax=Halalkalibacter oceani TaxID=1653776 RepID=A0A9X2IR25_9BACI|nr:hypothetical protein [Halalkalibacter oceani]MCM3716047.1 hypothetical protein [Halalkalibacter oceani]